MTQIKSFKDLGIKNILPKSFIGDQIAIKKILGKDITIHEFKTAPSKFNGTRLDMQITYNDEKRVIWTSSVYLMDTIKQIPKESFPFSTKIIEVDERYEFS